MATVEHSRIYLINFVNHGKKINVVQSVLSIVCYGLTTITSLYFDVIFSLM